MKTHTIRRRNAWAAPKDLEVAAGRSLKVGNEEISDKVRWIRSYVVKEDDGRLGTVCIYQAVSPEAIREHAELVAHEITEVVNTVVVREDPKQEQSAA